nr:hypothetical protein 1 [Virus sp.]
MNRQKSIGFIRKTDRIGVYSYSGSTIPGMSGAGYFFGNLLVGIHDGAQGDINVGFSVSAVVREMGMIFEAEASEDLLNLDTKTRAGLKKMGWTNEDVDEWCKGAWREDDSWVQKLNSARVLAQGESSKKNVGIKIGKIGVTLPGDVVKTQSSDGEVIHLDGSNVIGHSDNQPLVEAPSATVKEVKDVAVETPDDCSDTWRLGSFGDLESRVKVLEMLVRELLKAQEVKEQREKEKEAEYVKTLEMKLAERLSLIKDSVQQEVAARVNKMKKCSACGKSCPSLSSLRKHRKFSCEKSIPMKEFKQGVSTSKGAIKKESAFAADRVKTVKERPFLGKRQSSRIASDSPYSNTLSTRVRSSDCLVLGESQSEIPGFQPGVSQDLRRRLERMVGRFSEVELN